LHRSIKFGMYGLVLAGLLGGTAAWVSAGKSVDIRIDGQDRKVHTTASSVKGVLDAAHVPVGEHDIVAPDLASPVKSGAQIIIDRGHLLHLSVDGVARNVWVNADSVDEALGQLGYTSQDLVSVSRSKRLDAGATSVSISSPKHLAFKIGGKVVAVTSAGPNVYQAISDGGITLAANDRLSVPGGSAIRDGEVITIQHVRYGSSVQQITVPYSTVQQKDPNSYVGTDSVITPGKNGLKQVTYQLIYVDGKLTGKVPTKTIVLSPAIAQLNSVGTKQVPVATAIPAGAAQQIAAGMVTAHGWGSDQFGCLVSLWNKESGWRTDAANASGAYGIPQALPGSKMSSAGADWQTSAKTQITWGLQYISGVYGTPCAAWAHSQATNWY
jgi:uncharacterized protein YabE (DUF348 family)